MALKLEEKIPLLEDANDAGTKNSHLCTLIITEGDSAKSLAVAGLSVVGRDRFGVFPLRGKMLNVRDASSNKIMRNTEVNALLQILGLRYGVAYKLKKEMKTLRYGKIMIMADQDQDGSHIKGLIINFIHHNWPNLLRNNFLEEFITPIVKATKDNKSLSFYSLPEYMEWRRHTENWNTYKIKYYKGLGTSSAIEAKEYFTDMVRHRIGFDYSGKADDDAVELAFSKKRIMERKTWLTRWMAIRKERRERGECEDYLYECDTRFVTFSDFINKELVLFSNSDNERSIPNLVDGLKPGQRKILFTCFKRADKREIKVAQLAGSVGEMSAYHHGEQSLMMTIINLAQDFVGSNNINLLLPNGQFGTRLQGGKDAASPRYIFTQLNPVTRALFPQTDDYILHFLYEENQRVEPEWYCPIIPVVLVNGAEGIGTAYATRIPNYNPRELITNIRRLIRGKKPMPLIPWYSKFNGSIIRTGETRFACFGQIAIIDNKTIEISELPVKTWTQTYKETVLEPMLECSNGKLPMITGYKEYNTEEKVKFVVSMRVDQLKRYAKEGLHKVFKLRSIISTSCMILFDAEGNLRKFNTPEEICQEFFIARQRMYLKRKDFLEGMLAAQSERLSEQARFIMLKINNIIEIENNTKKAIIDQLITHNFKADPVKTWINSQHRRELEMSGELTAQDEIETSNLSFDEQAKEYDYLVNMAIWKLSQEDKNMLLVDSAAKEEELRQLQEKSWSDLWEEDLQTLEKTLFDTKIKVLERSQKREQETPIKFEQLSQKRFKLEQC